MIAEGECYGLVTYSLYLSVIIAAFVKIVSLVFVLLRHVSIVYL